MLYGILYLLGGIIAFIIATAILWHQIFPPKTKDQDNS